MFLIVAQQPARLNFDPWADRSNLTKRYKITQYKNKRRFSKML